MSHGQPQGGGMGGPPMNLNNLGQNMQQSQQQQQQMQQQLQQMLAQNQQRQQGLQQGGSGGGAPQPQQQQPQGMPQQPQQQQPSVQMQQPQQPNVQMQQQQQQQSAQMNGLPIRSYLDQTVVPILLDGTFVSCLWSSRTCNSFICCNQLVLPARLGCYRCGAILTGIALLCILVIAINVASTLSCYRRPPLRSLDNLWIDPIFWIYTHIL